MVTGRVDVFFRNSLRELKVIFAFRSPVPTELDVLKALEGRCFISERIDLTYPFQCGSAQRPVK